MSWVAVAVGVGSAAAGAYGSSQSASAARNASRGAGQVDITHTADPGLGSAGARTDIYSRARDLAVNPTQTFDQWNQARGGGGAGGGGAAGGKVPAGMRRNRQGKLVPARGGAGGGGGGAPAAPAFNGVSAETDRVRNAMIARAEAGNPLYGTAEDYTSRTLGGDDQNAYRRETFDAMRDVGDPDLDRLKEYLFGQLQGGGGDGLTSGSGGWTGRSVGGGGGGGGGEGPVGAAAYIKAMLDEQYGENPFLDQSIADANDDAMRAFASQVIPGLNSEYAGAGMFGSSMYQNALAQTGEAQTRGLAKESNARRAADYDSWQARRMNALGLGTEYDMNAENASASRAGSAASSASARDALDLQRQGMLLDSLGGAVGRGVDLREFGLGGMGALAGDFSSDQQFALGGVPEITGLGLRDWGAAGDLSLGADQNRSQFQLGREDIAARRASANQANRLAQQAFNFDVFRDERGFPMANMGGAADIIARLTDPYATTREFGTDRRSQSPYLGSPTGEAIAGGLGAGLTGYQLAQMYQRGGGGGGSSVGLTQGSVPYGGGSSGYYLNFGG